MKASLLGSACGPGPSVLLGLDVALVVVRAVAVHGTAGVKARRGVLERQRHVGQLLLDLFDRLGAEVADVQQVLLAAGDKLADRVDALALEAVVGADREVQLLDRQGQVRGQRGVRGRRADVDASASRFSSRARPNSSTSVLPALATASRGRMEGLVSTSMISRSKSVRCSTRVASTL